MFGLAIEEISFVEIRSKNGEEKQKQDGDDHNVTDVGDGVDQ